GLDGGDRVLEDHLVRAVRIQHEREAIEILDAPLDLLAIHHPDGHGELLATHEIEKDVLDVRLRGGRRFSRGNVSRHEGDRPRTASRDRSWPATSRVRRTTLD